MSALIVPTTEIEAVNECLSNIGQAPVSNITGELGVDTQMALGFVRSVNREVQSQGWFWNTDIDYPLEPTADGDIIIPVNALNIDSSGPSKDLDVVQRGRVLYNRLTHSYKFADTVYVEIVFGLPFNELPEPARRYIALRAARLFQNRVEGSASQEDAQDEMRAYAELRAVQLRNEDVNMLTGNLSTFDILNRYR